MLYYFAYGSNMNHEQMKNRCSIARFITRAKLEDYKFVYDGYSSTRKGAVANIIKSDDNVVEGGVFEVDDNCMKKLDSYEGYPNSYQKETLEVKDESGLHYQAFVYVRQPLRVGKPSKEYRNVILQGARDCGLSENYIKTFIKE